MPTLFALVIAGFELRLLAIWLKPFKSSVAVFPSFCPKVSDASAGRAPVIPSRRVPTSTAVLDQKLPVEFRVASPASVRARVALGMPIELLTVTFPVPRRNNVPVKPPSLTGPFRVMLPVGEICTFELPDKLTGPLMTLDPAPVTCERRLIAAPFCKLVMLIVRPAGSVIPGKSSVVAFPFAPPAG